MENYIRVRKGFVMSKFVYSSSEKEMLYYNQGQKIYNDGRDERYFKLYLDQVWNSTLDIWLYMSFRDSYHDAKQMNCND
jgi:hypothetical protein